jgi:hypothetical protein
MRRGEVQIKLSIPFIGEVSGSWVPDDAERQAAWELYIELITRIAVVPLGAGEGMLREALTSLHSMFSVTREILRRHGPGIAPRDEEKRLSVAYLAVAVLNGWLRPLLTAWHPRLRSHEAAKPADLTAEWWEDRWECAEQLRQEIERVRSGLIDYARQLGNVAKIASLLPTDRAEW